LAHAAATTLQVPPPLAIGTVKLEDGSSVKGFVCEGWVAGALMLLLDIAFAQQLPVTLAEQQCSSKWIGSLLRA
jgi:hypothetical protein